MKIHPWQEVEIVLTATVEYDHPYTDVDVHVDFTHESGATLRRPAFWDGDRIWKVRFASPVADGRWQWQSFCSVADEGFMNNDVGHSHGGDSPC
ncbi:MAG: DUF5060 domain-containing protein [Anaerolineales bacterium]|nr:DUF5060 domain-containing protein [Anaerolineales bacterium]